MKLRVEYAYDPESHNWSFRVPSLGIVGGAESREDAGPFLTFASAEVDSCLRSDLRL